MSDIFKEQLIKKMPSSLDLVKKVGIIVALVLVAVVVGGGLIFSLQGGFMAVVLFFMIGYGLACLGRFLLGRLNIEYEYAFTNGTLDVDVIYSKARRKHLMTTEIKNLEIMARLDNKDQQQLFKDAAVVYDFSSGVHGPNTFAFLTHINGKKTKVIIEPNEMMMQAFSTCLSSRKLLK